MIYQVFSDGAIFPSNIDIVVHFIKVRSNDENIQELKKKPLEELRSVYRICRNYDDYSLFCFSKDEAEQASNYVIKTGYFPL